jgi:predicted secreted Zn-dependent protease
MTGRWRLLAVAAALAVAACSPPAPPQPGNGQAAQAPSAPQRPAIPEMPADLSLANIEGVDVQYYDVSGNSLFEIRRALNRVRPRDPNDGLSVDALSHWYISWRWPDGPNGSGCDLGRAELRFTGAVRMPRLVETPATPEAVRIRWRRYAEALARHEAGHIRHAYDNQARILAAIRASTCANAGDAALEATRALARWDLQYDRLTAHGASQGARFP